MALITENNTQYYVGEQLFVVDPAALSGPFTTTFNTDLIYYTNDTTALNFPLNNFDMFISVDGGITFTPYTLQANPLYDLPIGNVVGNTITLATPKRGGVTVQENEVVREALKKAHIFAYPNIWPETSCIAAMEAMSAGVCIIAPNHAALPETTANFALMYQMQEDQNVHANTFASILDQVITTYWNSHMQQRIQLSKIYADSFYSWDVRKFEWQNLLTSLSRM